MKTIIFLSSILFSILCSATSLRKSIECEAGLMFAQKSGIKLQKLKLPVTIDKDGTGQSIIETSDYSVNFSVEADYDLKKLFHVTISILDKVIPSPVPNNENRMFSYAQLTPKTWLYKEPSRLHLSNYTMKYDNGGGIALFTPSAFVKLYNAGKVWDDSIVSAYSVDQSYIDAAKKAVRTGALNAGDLLGLIVYDVCL